MAYTVNYVPAALVERLQGSAILALFMRVETDPALHIWFGVNDVPARFDSIDETGQVYYGGGRLAGLPTLEMLLGGASDVVDFTLSGVDPETGNAMLDSLPEVRGAAVHIGATVLDDYYQPVTNIIPMWQGVAARVTENMPPVSRGEMPTLTLSLSVVAGENMRSRPSRSVWTASQQKTVSPTDRFCDNTGRLARTVSPAWPNF
ncbi:hypothetical protein [Rhizobium sp. SGZ-381]|uniref:hypothetical protein n=1 Tax=Rhizobium sp. SGZ-381 TaxID=3342800 RepID=UPI00366A6434